MLLFALAACDGGGATPDDTGPAAFDCSTLDLALPSQRGEVQGVWDDVNGRFLVFGGDEGTPVDCQSQTSFVDDTWAWVPECGAFQSLAAESGPSARGRYVMAMDEARGRLLLHGGRTRDGTRGDYTLLDDTWALDLATDTWELLAESGPGGRSNHAAAVLGDRLVVYGGNESPDGAVFEPLKDVWALDLTTNEWSELDPGAGPGKRLFHAVTASADGTRLYAYGGGDENAFLGPFFGDLWELDPDGGWTELHAGGRGAPDNRIWPNLLAEPGGESLLLWAGHDDQELGNRNDMWRFDLASGEWEQLAEGDVYNAPANGFCDFPADFVAADLSAPERRNAAAAALDSEGSLWIFGGKTDCGLINDVWSWRDGTWTEASPATGGEICERAFAECDTMCF